jgi:Family of unknown function (DUF6600)/FecR protein
MNNRLNFKHLVLGIGALSFFAGSLAWAQELSHARVVRLSFKEGNVTLVRPDSPAGMAASVNTPIQEGFKLATAEDSFLEVEFENTSTARVGQLSELDFNQLALDPNGAKLNRMELRQGYATFSVIPEDGDVYEVKAGDATVNLASDKKTRFRVDLDNGQVRVEVFKGAAEVSSLFGSERLTKNMVLELRPGADQPLSVSSGITKDAWDEWVEDRENQAQLAHRRSPPGLYTNDVTSLLYGWNDLYYYGSWANVPGYGYGWIPAMGYGWTPYSYGQWVWYPGYGYTWVSYEPWGWVPFHYGGWVYQAGYGWCWIPGGFSMWSPSLVTWYQGPDWVAWSARPPRPRPGGRPTPAGPACAAGQTCFTAMSTESFRAGLPVRGNRLPTVSVTEGNAVARPDVQPAELGGAGFASGPAGIRSHTSPAASGPATRVTIVGGAALAGQGTRPVAAPAAVRQPVTSRPGMGSRPAGVSTQGNVVFDPAEGRYVNGATKSPEPARVEAPASSTVAPSAPAPPQEAPSTVAPSPRPAPERSHQSPAPSPALSSDHHASPSTGVEASRPAGTFERTLSSWGVASPTRQSSPASSGSWSAPSSRNTGSFGVSRGGSSGGSISAAPRGGGGGGGVRSAPSSGGATPHR